MLGLPDSVYQKYEDVCHKCRVCSTSIAPPPRALVLVAIRSIAERPGTLATVCCTSSRTKRR